MLDFLMLGFLIGAFACAVGYVHACLAMTGPGKVTDREP